MQCSGAWHVMPSVNSMAAHMAAASLGTSCQASYQLLHAMQWCLAHHAWLQLNGCPAYMAAASYHTMSNRGPSHSGTSNSSGIRGRASGLTITTDEEASICSSSSFGSKLGQSSPSHRASHELLTMGARMQFELTQAQVSCGHTSTAMLNELNRRRLQFLLEQKFMRQTRGSHRSTTMWPICCLVTEFRMLSDMHWTATCSASSCMQKPQRGSCQFSNKFMDAGCTKS